MDVAKSLSDMSAINGSLFEMEGANDSTGGDGSNTAGGSIIEGEG